MCSLEPWLDVKMSIQSVGRLLCSYQLHNNENLIEHRLCASSVLSALHTYLDESSQCSEEEIIIISTLLMRKLRGYKTCPMCIGCQVEKAGCELRKS